MKIAIVTDSVADVPQTLVEKYNIKVVPLSVHFGGKSYLDRVDITNQEFFEYIGGAKTLPTTSQPAPAQFIDTYRACIAEGADKILSIHFSSEMSGTYQGAKMAAEMMEEEIDIEVIDSRTVTVGLGILVAGIAQLIEDHPEMAWEEILEHIDKMTKASKILFFLDSLDNLQKGGRIGKASYMVGSVLNIKPILIVEDGLIGVHDKVRGKKLQKAIDRLTDEFIEMIDPSKKIYFAWGYNNEAYLEVVKENLKQKLEKYGEFDHEQLMDYEIGCVTTTHVGLGAFGIAFYQV